MNNHWPVQEAKARFSDLLNTCINLGPQIVTRRGLEEAVLVPINKWRELQNSTKPSLKSFLLSESNRFELTIPKRVQRNHRKSITK
ncbi:MAG: type II toxin-antitoxin system Phd/YefM family antitoxin [Betaproteobacteria bacterium]